RPTLGAPAEGAHRKRDRSCLQVARGASLIQEDTQRTGAAPGLERKLDPEAPPPHSPGPGDPEGGPDGLPPAEPHPERSPRGCREPRLVEAIKSAWTQGASWPQSSAILAGFRAPYTRGEMRGTRTSSTVRRTFSLT